MRILASQAGFTELTIRMFLSQSSLIEETDSGHAAEALTEVEVCDWQLGTEPS